MKFKRISILLVAFVTGACHANNDFKGGRVRVGSYWSNGLPTAANPGTLAKDGIITEGDVTDLVVTQTGGTVTAYENQGIRELQNTSWTLQGGLFQRTKGLRLGSGSAAPTYFHVAGGTLVLAVPGHNLIVDGGDSRLRITGGLATVAGNLQIDATAGHDNSPVLEFGLGEGAAIFRGLQFDAAGYINFETGSRGILRLTHGVITGSDLNPETDTFEELWSAGRLRLDGANGGQFQDVFRVNVDEVAQTLRLLVPFGPDIRITEYVQTGSVAQVDWNQSTNHWIIEGASTISDLPADSTLLSFSSGAAATNRALFLTERDNEFIRLQTGIQVLDGFYDPALIEAIKQASLNVAGPTSHVYNLDIAGLSLLNASGFGITNPAGLNLLAELEVLDLSNNPVTNLNPVASIDGLTGLDLWRVGIDDMQWVGSLTNLLWIGTSENEITDVSSFANLGQLEMVDLAGNPLTDLGSLSALNQIMSLNIVETGVTDLTGLESLTQLEYVNLRGNQISNLSPISTMTSLVWLDASDNQLSNADGLASLTNLSWVGLNDNQITNIAGLANATGIKWLGLHNNDIAELSGIGSLTNLTWLNLESNKVSNLNDISSLTNLRAVNLYSNEIVSLSGLEGLTNLDWIDLDFNAVTDLGPLVTNAMLGGMSKGTVISVRGNPLSSTAVSDQIPMLRDAYKIVVLFD